MHIVCRLSSKLGTLSATHTYKQRRRAIRQAKKWALSLNDVFGELQHGLQPRKSKRPQIKQPTDCKTSSDHVGWQSIILHPLGMRQHRNLVAASGMSGQVYPAPTTAERFARTLNPGDRRPALTRDFGQRDLRTKCVISYHHREAERDRSPRNPAEFFTAVRTPIPAVDKNENRRTAMRIGDPNSTRLNGERLAEVPVDTVWSGSTAKAPPSAFAESSTEPVCAETWPAPNARSRAMIALVTIIPPCGNRWASKLDINRTGAPTAQTLRSRRTAISMRQ